MVAPRAEPFIIAIDGTVASGKSTLARRLAARYGFPHLNTGLLYRAVGFATQQAGYDTTDHAAIVAMTEELVSHGDTAILDNPELLSVGAGQMASIVAQIPGVRAALLEWQHNFPIGHKGAVLDGRDITSVIFPNAPAKFMVTADVETRAKRRMLEYPGETTLDAMVTFMNERDERDRWNIEAISEGRILLDTTHLNVAETEAKAAEIIDERLKNWPKAA